MTTKLAGKDTYFLPSDQGSNGAGSDGGAGNPSNPNGYPAAYRLASLFDGNNKPIFSSVIVVSDRTVLDAQLQEAISGLDHKLVVIETIGEDKNSQDLKNAINDGVRIIVTTLQKFPVIYTEVEIKNIVIFF